MLIYQAIVKTSADPFAWIVRPLGVAFFVGTVWLVVRWMTPLRERMECLELKEGDARVFWWIRPS